MFLDDSGQPILDTIHHCDALDLLRALPDGCIDMILCDLPYAVLAAEWDKLIPIDEWWVECHRTIKPQGAIVLTAKQPFSSLLITSNLKKYRYSWYWEKSGGANIHQTNYRPLAVIEEILIFSHSPAVYSSVPTMNYHPPKMKLEKPYKRAFKKQHALVANRSSGAPMSNPERIIGIREYEYATPRNLLYADTDGDERVHPTQKPVALFEYLIRTYTQPGEIILDPCVGSGTTAIAARQTGRHFICGDKELQYVNIARARLAKPYTEPMFVE